MPSVARKLLRLLGFSAYVVVVAGVFVASAYLAFNLFVRSGTTRVPEIVGLDRQTAAGELADSGLRMTLAEGGGRYDPRVPAGHVIEQVPSASSLVKRGTAVVSALSLGPQRLSVPELEGKSLQSAQVTLAAAGMTLGDTLKVYSPTTPPGVVVAQQPLAGGMVSPATEVRLFLAQAGGARRFVMPDLIYRDYDEVRGFFERSGLRLGRVTFEVYEGARRGTILRQFPLAGHALTAGDAISLVVATGEVAEDRAAGSAPPLDEGWPQRPSPPTAAAPAAPAPPAAPPR